jgi:hypothetical protein
MTNARLHLATVTAAATTATTLFALHPPALGRAGALPPLVIAFAWLVATGLSAWLALTSGTALLAVVTSRRAPSSVARFAPAFVRRMVEVALVGSCIVGSAVPASATSWKTRRDVPVVRAPAAVTTTTTPPATIARPTPPTTVTATSTPRQTAPVTSAPVTAPHSPSPSVRATPPRGQRARPANPPERAVIPRVSRRYTVRPGDNLWSISRAALGGTAGDAEVAPYWHALIAANRSGLRSGDPNLIYPGEVLGLPDRGVNQ